MMILSPIIVLLFCCQVRFLRKFCASAPTSSSACLQPHSLSTDPGCITSRWIYDVERKECVGVTACPGKSDAENNFKSYDDCAQSCNPSLVAEGQSRIQNVPDAQPSPTRNVPSASEVKEESEDKEIDLTGVISREHKRVCIGSIRSRKYHCYQLRTYCFADRAVCRSQDCMNGKCKKPKMVECPHPLRSCRNLRNVQSARATTKPTETSNGNQIDENVDDDAFVGGNSFIPIQRPPQNYIPIERSPKNFIPVQRSPQNFIPVERSPQNLSIRGPLIGAGSGRSKYERRQCTGAGGSVLSLCSVQVFECNPSTGRLRCSAKTCKGTFCTKLQSIICPPNQHSCP